PVCTRLWAISARWTLRPDILLNEVSGKSGEDHFDWLGSGDDWLPTSHPQEWMARPGSAADGRMDFLTVFFHEYGHALGLEHSHDAHDLMATTLTPGVRRLPSPDDMALFATVNSLADEAAGTPQPATFSLRTVS
ncbi:MAG: matrixin family metalloprotease, partial [Moraxellaceae bacterium]|nr:matrixin family metalloprotease [Moraxellaceae bacterium]